MLFNYNVFSAWCHKLTFALCQILRSRIYFPHLKYIRDLVQFIIHSISSLAIRLRTGTKWRIPWDGVIYSASVVDREISDRSLKLHKIGTYPKINRTPVILFTLTWSILSSVVCYPAKSASVYKSILIFFVSSSMMIPFLGCLSNI